MSETTSQSGNARRGPGRPRLQRVDNATTTVQALDRGLTLLQLLARQGACGLTDLSLQVGMPAPTAHRLLTTMLKHQFVEFDDTSQEWSIGVETYSVGTSYLRRTNLVELARPVMRQLMEDTGETANLAVVEGGEVVFISQVESTHPIRAFHRPGSRSQVHASGIGKAWLATLWRDNVMKVLQGTGLPEFTERTLCTPKALFDDLKLTRERGWSFDDEEHFAGMRCVAAPIVDAREEAIAGVSVSGPTARFSDNRVAELGSAVRRAAQHISRELGANRSNP